MIDALIMMLFALGMVGFTIFSICGTIILLRLIFTEFKD